MSQAESSSSHLYGLFLVLLAWMLWSIDPIIVRFIGPMSSLALTGMTLSFGGLSAIIPGYKAWQKRSEIPTSFYFLFVFYVIFCTALPDFCYVIAVRNLHPALVSITLRSQLIIVVLLGYFLLSESLNYLSIIGIVLVLLGNILNGYHHYSAAAGLESATALKGWIFAMAAMLCWGMGTVTGKVLLKKIPPPSLTAMRLSSAGILMLSLALLKDGTAAFAEVKSWQLLLIISKGCLVSALAYTIYFYGLRKVKSGIAAALEQIAPILTCFYAWIFFKELITWKEAGFGAIIIAGTLTIIAGELIGKIKTSEE